MPIRNTPRALAQSPDRDDLSANAPRARPLTIDQAAAPTRARILRSSLRTNPTSRRALALLAKVPGRVARPGRLGVSALAKRSFAPSPRPCGGSQPAAPD